MPVMHVIPALPVGGAETLVFQMVRGLDRSRFAPAVAVLGDLGPMGEEIRRAGIEVVALEGFVGPGRLPRLVPRLAGVFRARRIRIVHTHLYHGNYYGRLAALVARTPVVVASIHNVYDRVKLHRRWVNRLLGPRTDAILAGSESVRQDILRWDGVSPERVSVLPYGIDLTPYERLPDRASARAALGLPDGVRVIGTVGRLEIQKGHDLLLQSVARLDAEGAGVCLVLVGDGRERSGLERMASALGLGDVVRFLGTRRDLPAVLAALDLFALPSRWEGTPLALIAALASGLPVVATPVGGVPEILEDGVTGRLVPAEDVEALAHALRDLLGDLPAARALGARGKAYVKAHCSVEVMLRQLENLYLDLEARAGRRMR
jgi:glycosyltransferase involved in cell wall biosynthesis